MFSIGKKPAYISRKRNKEAHAYLADLLLLLRKHFDEEELRVLCFELSVNFQDLPGSGRAAKMEELLMLQAREGYIDSLVTVCREQRDMVTWPTRPEFVSKTDLMLAATPDQPISKNRRHQLILLERVNKFWIEDVFANSVHHETLIELNKRQLETAVAEDNSWKMVLAKPGDDPKPRPPDMHILDVFEEMGRTILVLGEPGAGKTTTLLQLANELINQARLNPDFPIPVIFSLSTWQGEPLSNWLATELFEKYKIPKKIAHNWVTEDGLLLLLDGLDEVPSTQQDACIEAINEYRNEHGFTGIAVCSRAHEYEALTTRLQFNGAVVLEPLTEEQVENYLQKVASNSMELQQRLLNDVALQELTKSPLMLSVMTVAYRGTVENGKQRSSIKDSREQIFDTYVKQMLSRGQGQNEFSSQQTIVWLNNLAQKLRQHNKSTFFMEDMQPSWLPTKKQQRLHSILSKLFIVLIFAIVAGAYVIGNGIATQTRSGETIERILIVGFTQAICVVLVAATIVILSFWMRTWVAILITAVLFLFLNQTIQPTIIIGIIYGLAAGGTAVSTTKNNNIKIITVNFTWRKALWGIVVALIGVVGMVLAGDSTNLSIITFALFLFGLFSIIPLGMSGRRDPLDEKIYPNQGIRESTRTALKVCGIILLMSLFIGILIGAIITSINGEPLQETVPNVIIISMLFGLVLALIMSFYYGGASGIQQLILRVQLSRSNIFPWNIASFLNLMTRCVLLQQVGGSYIFIHRLFLEYFADPYLVERKIV